MDDFAKSALEVFTDVASLLGIIFPILITAFGFFVVVKILSIIPNNSVSDSEDEECDSDMEKDYPWIYGIHGQFGKKGNGGFSEPGYDAKNDLSAVHSDLSSKR